MPREEEPHVLHVVRTLGRTGGMEQNLYRIVETLRARGIRHTIALLSDFPEIIDFGDLAPVHRLVTAPNDPRLVIMLRRLMREVRPTVVHARNWGAWPDPATARLLVRPRPPLVWSFHGIEVREAALLRHRIAFRALSRVTTRVFAVSDAARSFLVEQYGLSRQRIELLPNGVDTDRYHPARERSPGRLRFGVAGRLHHIKNFPLAVRAFASARKAGAEAELLVAGSGGLRETLETLARELGVGDDVQFLGHVTDMPAFYRSLDGFILSSDYEANPNALLEAMSSGLACVATDVGGVSENTDHGRVARLVPRGEVQPLADVLLDWTKNELARTELGRDARKHVAEHASRRSMMDRYELLYRSPRES